MLINKVFPGHNFKYIFSKKYYLDPAIDPYAEQTKAVKERYYKCINCGCNFVFVFSTFHQCDTYRFKSKLEYNKFYLIKKNYMCGWYGDDLYEKCSIVAMRKACL